MSTSNYFKEKCSYGEQSRSVWQTIRPYMSDKGETHYEIIPCKDDKIVPSPGIVETIFNNYFITAIDGIGITEDINDLSIPVIIEKYRGHLIIIRIENKYNRNSFSLKQVSVKNMEMLSSCINPRKATGVDQLPPKLVRIVGSAIAPSMTALVNNATSFAPFPTELKCVELSPVFKR